MRPVSGGQVAFASCMTDTKRHQWGALLDGTARCKQRRRLSWQPLRFLSLPFVRMAIRIARFLPLLNVFPPEWNPDCSQNEDQEDTGRPNEQWLVRKRNDQPQKKREYS